MKIYLAVLTMGNMHHVLSQRLNEIISETLKQNKHQIYLVYSGVINVNDNRNIITKRFLESDCDYLLMVDSDNPPIRNPIDLVDLDLDVVACPTPMFTEGVIKINCFDKIESGYMSKVYEGKDLFECDRVGSGCILIARRVLEKIKCPFAPKLDEDGIVVESEDMNFSFRAKEAGFKVWGHWDHLCNHFKEVNLLDILKLLKRS